MSLNGKHDNGLSSKSRMMNIPRLTLNNGVSMPILGLGVWRIDKSHIKHLILNAINIGYRHLIVLVYMIHFISLTTCFLSILLSPMSFLLGIRIWN